MRTLSGRNGRYACPVARAAAAAPRSREVSGVSHASSPIRVLDLFAGAGGLTCGFHAASDRFETVTAVEMDVDAAATYRQNFGDVVYHGSIQDWLATGQVPRADVIVGGPPCQGFSTLGKQNVEDERNTLWHEYAKTIALAKPKYFVVENVATFLKSKQYEDFLRETHGGKLLAAYRIQSTVLNAADFGAPQARKRAVLIGHLATLPFPGFPEPTTPGAHLTVRQGLKGVRRSVTKTTLPARNVAVGDRVLAGPFTSRELHLGRDYEPLSLARFASIPPGGNRFDLPEALKARCWVGHTSGSGDVMGRMHWDQPSVTIRTEFFKPEKGRYLHPEEDRAITHFEAARLQGFPDDFKWIGSKTSIARQIGNAVPIPLARAIGAHLVAAIDRES